MPLSGIKLCSSQRDIWCTDHGQPARRTLARHLIYRKPASSVRPSRTRSRSRRTHGTVSRTRSSESGVAPRAAGRSASVPILISSCFPSGRRQTEADTRECKAYKNAVSRPSRVSVVIYIDRLQRSVSRARATRCLVGNRININE